MARGLRGLPRRGLWLLLVSHLFMATACQDATFSTLLQELCLAQFQVDMEAVGRPLWCDWGKTIGLLQDIEYSSRCYTTSSPGTSLVAQWLRIRLPMQGSQVRALVWGDPTCRGETKPTRHNY
ncbi:receptor activity-modifying protein 1 isoform X4 [Pseudorca crassidens]|uniref:receptor activity-modifying protein 1 isoform X4 n=1 Tax=Pseudorca crassidens TaxID=82174 RepID=UPI00352DCEEF